MARPKVSEQIGGRAVARRVGGRPVTPLTDKQAIILWQSASFAPLRVKLGDPKMVLSPAGVNFSPLRRGLVPSRANRQVTFLRIRSDDC